MPSASTPTPYYFGGSPLTAKASNVPSNDRRERSTARSRSGAQGTGAPEGEEPGFGRAGGEGIALGRVTLRPYVSAAWVDADVLAFDNPVPVRDQYLQVAPGVTASLPLLDGIVSLLPVS